jgi:phage terminase large subunit GpA-like protein
MMMASQTSGKTETINNMVGKDIDIDPCPMLVIQPTLDMGETWSKDRLATMLRDTPALRGKVKDPKSRDSGNKILSKRFPGGHITIAGANAPSGLASRPIRKVYFDEVDRYPASAGTEGDPIALAENEPRAFPTPSSSRRRRPTLGISRIEKSFDQSDKRYWFVVFPCCGHETNLRWEMIKWVDNDPKTAWLECPHCRAKHDDADRRLMVLKGRWKATAPFRNGIRGYHLNGIYVLFDPKKPYKTRLEQMVAAFIEANATGKMR